MQIGMLNDVMAVPSLRYWPVFDGLCSHDLDIAINFIQTSGKYLHPMAREH